MGWKSLIAFSTHEILRSEPTKLPMHNYSALAEITQKAGNLLCSEEHNFLAGGRPQRGEQAGSPAKVRTGLKLSIPGYRERS